MEKKVYINKVSSYLPNNPVPNEDIELYLGLIANKPSRVKSVVLRQNGIKTRYYALTQKQEITHSSAELAIESINRLFSKKEDLNKVELLTCATSIADQILPSHASMVHGLMKNQPIEIFSASGVCLTSLQALKTAFLSVKAGDTKNAICSASEMVSASLLSKHYDEEYEKCADLGTNPYMAFEKDFLRFMLSDGAGAVFLEDKPSQEGISFEIEWIKMKSYANELPTCMFMGAELREDGELKSWKAYTNEELVDRSVFTVKQDIRLLKEYGVTYCTDFIESLFKDYDTPASKINYFIPHVSSMFFYNKLLEEFMNRKIDLGEEKWYTNLKEVGNIGSASIFVALEGLIKQNRLKKGDRIWLMVPESGRFSYGIASIKVY